MPGRPVTTGASTIPIRWQYGPRQFRKNGSSGEQPARFVHLHYHSGGLRLNPNLYTFRTVCPSLLNTWSGSQSEMWTLGKSTMLQVLLSIQALVLNEKPYFNEPGLAPFAGQAKMEKMS